MALNLSALTDYAWADIAKAAKVAMVHAALGGTTLTINGRNIGRITIEEATKLHEFASEMQAIEAAAGTGGLNALVQFGEAM
jgi:hypothetical protein